MNARLKDLIARNGMPLDRVQALVDLAGGDEAWIESILTNATKTEKAAMLSGLKFKADDAPADDGGDEYPADVLNALEDVYAALGDWNKVTAALRQLAEPVDVRARILTDSGKQSSFPTAAKTYSPHRDVLAIAANADQLRNARPATKSTAPTLKSIIENAITHWDGR